MRGPPRNAHQAPRAHMSSCAAAHNHPPFTDLSNDCEASAHFQRLMFNGLGNRNPAVPTVFIDRSERRRKTGIRKRSHRNGHDVRLGFKRVPDCRTAVGAKAKTDLPTRVTHADEDIGVSSHPNRPHVKTCLRPEHAPGAPLTFQTMADRNADGFRRGCDDQLAAGTGGASRGHG